MPDQSQHTPGPWKAAILNDTQCVVGDGGKPQTIAAQMFDENADPSLDEIAANARLIAAAANSYDKHCGENAVQCAEDDLLGDALEVLESIIWKTNCSDGDKPYSVARNAIQIKDAIAVVARAKERDKK